MGGWAVSAHFSHLFLKFFCFSAFLRFGKRENRVQKAFCFPTPSHSSVPLVASWGRDQWPYPHLCTHPPPRLSPWGGGQSHAMCYIHFVQQQRSRPGWERTHERPGACKTPGDGGGDGAPGWGLEGQQGQREQSRVPSTLHPPCPGANLS